MDYEKPIGYLSDYAVRCLLNNATAEIVPPGMRTGNEETPVYAAPKVPMLGPPKYIGVDKVVKWPHPITRGQVEMLIYHHQRDGQNQLEHRLKYSGSYLIRVAETLRWCLEEMDLMYDENYVTVKLKDLEYVFEAADEVRAKGIDSIEAIRNAIERAHGRPTKGEVYAKALYHSVDYSCQHAYCRVRYHPSTGSTGGTSTNS